MTYAAFTLIALFCAAGLSGAEQAPKSDFLPNFVNLLLQPAEAIAGRGLGRSVSVDVPGYATVVGKSGLFGEHSGAFLGLPYAKQPVGDRRFRSPVPVGAVEGGSILAQRPGAACPQALPVVRRSEACLFLNVFTPALPRGADADLLPVVFWIHGGSFMIGDGYSEALGVPFYDGQVMANRGNVVVVSINYRLGMLGFLGLDALERQGGTAGNYGLQDQREAMRWVQRHIKAFGGDPDRVTLAGESAGAISIAFHLVAPQSRGLFRRAVLQSGNDASRDAPTADRVGRALAASAGCRPANATGADADAGMLACLRAAAVEDLLAATVPAEMLVDMSWAPLVDGSELSESVRARFEAGDVAAADVIVGTNANEAAIFACPVLPADMTRAAATEHLRGVFGRKGAAKVLEAYAFDDYASPRDLVVDVDTDGTFLCPSRRIARAVAGNGNGTSKATAFRYVLEHTPAFFAWLSPLFGGWPQDSCLGTPHMTDLAYVFKNLDFILTPAETVLSSRFVDLWTSFATSGAPGLSRADDGSIDGKQDWPQLDGNNHGPILRLDAAHTLRTAPALKDAQCDVLDTVVMHGFGAVRA